jgi:hypothetical protein
MWLEADALNWQETSSAWVMPGDVEDIPVKRIKAPGSLTPQI